MSADLDTDATSIARRQFSSTRRGFDPDEVRAYLRDVADVVDGLRRREADLLARAQAAESRTAHLDDLDEHRLVELLGEETARILDAGRAAAADIRRKAEESAGRLISDANEEAHRLRAEGEAERTALRNEKMAELESLRAEAAAELDHRRAEGAELVETLRRVAQAEADELVDEAQVVRERILGDLARRRRAAREQLEQLNAARERLLAAYDVVRRSVDEATGELTVALPEAKLAGEVAMRRVHEEPEPSLEELEDLVTMARVAGLLDQSRLDPEQPEDEAQEPEAEAEDEVEAIEEPEQPEVVDEVEVEVVEEVEVVAEVVVEPDPEVEVEPEPEVIAEIDLVLDDDEEDEDNDEEEHGDDDSYDLGEVPGYDDHLDQQPAMSVVTAPSSNVDALFARLKADVAVVEDEGGYDEEELLEEVELDDYPVEDDDEDLPDEDLPDDELEDLPDDELLDEDAGLASAPVAGDDELIRQRDDALVELEHELGRRLKRVLADEQNEVLDLLRRTKPSSSDELLPALGAHSTRYAEAVREELGAAAAWGAAAVGGEPDGVGDALAVELGQSVVEPLRERISRSFSEAGGDLDEVTERLRALYREWKSQRIGTAVSHYAAAAYAQGAYGAVPDGTPLRWVVDHGSDPCPDADDNALAGAVCKGDAFPTGDHCPPAHPGCRCMVVPAE